VFLPVSLHLRPSIFLLTCFAGVGTVPADADCPGVFPWLGPFALPPTPGGARSWQCLVFQIITMVYRSIQCRWILIFS